MGLQIKFKTMYKSLIPATPVLDFKEVNSHLQGQDNNGSGFAGLYYRKEMVLWLPSVSQRHLRRNRSL